MAKTKKKRTLADKLAATSYGSRKRLLHELVQNMNERADSSRDMAEIAAFLEAQVGGDADEIVNAHLGRELAIVER